jgi:hypothetical protein
MFILEFQVNHSTGSGHLCAKPLDKNFFAHGSLCDSQRGLLHLRRSRKPLNSVEHWGPGQPPRPRACCVQKRVVLAEMKQVSAAMAALPSCK